MTTSPSEALLSALREAVDVHAAPRLALAEDYAPPEVLVHLAVTGPLLGLN
jgi:hypothetical protein